MLKSVGGCAAIIFNSWGLTCENILSTLRDVAIIQVTDQDFEQQVLKNDKPVFLDFFAIWCGPCKLAEPVIEELSEQHKDIVFAKLDVDQSPQTPQKFGIMSIPTTVLFKNGQEVSRTTGFAGKKPYEDLLSKAK